MAKRVTRSGLAAKLGESGREAFETHKGDETVYSGGGELPAGIEGGIAQLVDCKFGVYEKGDNKGQYYFYASGVVLEPKTHGGVRVEGMRTKLGPEPLCDTPQKKSRPTLADHFKWVLNEMRKLGVDTKGVGYEDVETVAAALKESGPYFRFRTWKGDPTPEYPNPRTNEIWNGVVDYDPEASGSGDEVVEHAGDEGATADEGQDEAPFDDAVDLAALGAAADAEDADAQAQLTVLALEAGFDFSTIATWAEVAAMLLSGETPGAAGSDAAEEDKGPPSVGEVYYYKLNGKKTRAECEVVAVMEKTSKVNLKNLDDQSIIRNVAWTALYDTKE